MTRAEIDALLDDRLEALRKTQLELRRYADKTPDPKGPNATH